MTVDKLRALNAQELQLSRGTAAPPRFGERWSSPRGINADFLRIGFKNSPVGTAQKRRGTEAIHVESSGSAWASGNSNSPYG
jgi:hypothetical protein